MTATILRPAPLTASAFAPFGQIIEAARVEPVAINDGTTLRYHDLARVEVSRGGGHPLISIFVGQPFVMPVAIRMMERHPLGSQAVMPLSGRSYLVAVAADDGGKPGRPLVFLAGPEQGVSYAPGVWHHPLLALAAESRFLVVDRGGPGDNLEIRYCEAPGFEVRSP